jgi:hypothetical protein
MVTAEEITHLVNMRHLVVLPFHPTHIDRVGPSADDIELFSHIANMKERFETVAENKTGWTMFYKREPALCFGLEYKFATNAEAWLVPGPVAFNHGTLLCRGAMRFFDKIGPHLDLLRVQIVVSVKRDYAIQWAKFLKFKEEGLMKAYGPDGSDYIMYARTY